MNHTNTPNIKINKNIVNSDRNNIQIINTQSNSNIKIKRTFSEFLEERETTRHTCKEIISQIESAYDSFIKEENSSNWVEIFRKIIDNEKFIDNSSLTPKCLENRASYILENSKFWVLFTLYKKNSLENFKINDFLCIMNCCLEYYTNDLQLLNDFYLNFIKTFEENEILDKLPQYKYNKKIDSQAYLSLLKKSNKFSLFDGNTSLNFNFSNFKKPDRKLNLVNITKFNIDILHKVNENFISIENRPFNKKFITDLSISYSESLIPKETRIYNYLIERSEFSILRGKLNLGEIKNFKSDIKQSEKNILIQRISFGNNSPISSNTEVINKYKEYNTENNFKDKCKRNLNLSKTAIEITENMKNSKENPYISSIDCVKKTKNNEKIKIFDNSIHQNKNKIKSKDKFTKKNK